MSSKKKKKKNKHKHAQQGRPHAPSAKAAPATEAPHPQSTAGTSRLNLTCELQEDAHLGSGLGTGDIDALVALDRDGRPVIRRTHLTGLLRKLSLRLLAKERTEELFGAAGGRNRTVHFTSLVAEGNPTMRVWRSSKRVSFDNRAPKEDFLRSVERVAAGTKFSGQVQLSRADEADVKKLLSLLREIGSRRSAGWGRISLTVQSRSLRPTTATVQFEPKTRLRILFKSLDPACFPDTAIPVNVIPTLPYIPGSTLRGAFAAWLLRQVDKGAAQDFVNQVSIGDANPLPDKPKHALAEADVLPAPLALRTRKRSALGNGMPWWAYEQGDSQWLDGTSGSAPDLKRPPKDMFVYRHSSRSGWTSFRPDIRIRLRNGRDDASAVDTALFSIEEISERTYFLAEVREVSEKRFSDLEPLLTGTEWLLLGKSGTPFVVEAVEWSDPDPITIQNDCYLILESNTLLRDDRLGWRTSLDGKVRINNHVVHLTALAEDIMEVSGFNGTSRLWRPSCVAIRRGSTYRVGADAVKILVEASQHGVSLGERSNEGYGRWRLVSLLPGVTETDTRPVTRAVYPGRPDSAHEAIAGRAKELAEKHPKSGGPSVSQWYTLLSEMKNDATGPIQARLNPQTLGSQSFATVREILAELQSDPERRTTLAFVIDWLRTR